MLQILSENIAQMQNVYTPIPFKVHIVFCILATLLYAFQFYRKHSVYYILIMLAIDFTLTPHFSANKTVIAILFVVEIVLILLAFISSYVHNKKIKNKNAVAEKHKKQEEQHQKEIDKMDIKENEKIVDHAFDDEDMD